MATAERPPAKIDGKPNPAYQAWYRAQKKARAEKPGRKTVEILPGPTENTVIIYREPWPIGAPTPAPEILTLRVIGPAKNSNFMWCDHAGNKVAVRVDKRYAKRVLGKSIPARAEADGTFTHVP